MKNVLCSLFGHKPPVYKRKGWYSPGEQYGTVVVGPSDGIKRVHGYVNGECARCGQIFMVARIHIPAVEVVQYCFSEGNESNLQSNKQTTAILQ